LQEIWHHRLYGRGLGAQGVRRRGTWNGHLDRFAGLIVGEIGDLVAAGVLADRDYSLTAVAIVGAIKELITTWAVRASGFAVDDIVEEAVRFSVAAMIATAFDR
jgi:hypothetical protein